MQGKEYSRKGPTIRIRVNLQGMDLSRKSRSGIRMEQYLQGKEFARNGISKERTLQGMRTMLCLSQFCIGGSIWPAIPVYVM